MMELGTCSGERLSGILHVVNGEQQSKVLFTGMRVDFWKELSLKFCDYCEVYDRMGNISRSRSDNAVGSWALMK
jgi:hypothetical protein